MQVLPRRAWIQVLAKTLKSKGKSWPRSENQNASLGEDVQV